MKINIKVIENGMLPEYKTEGSAGADCFARINEKVIVKPKTVETIPLGFAVELPNGFEMQIRGRSGLARKNWVQVFNSPGTIDSDYRGEVGAILYNASDVDFEVNPFDRIAQAVIAPIIQANWEVKEDLSDTKRGAGGFGSTGIASKFYEPFQTVEETEIYLNKKVVVINDIMTFIQAELEETAVGKKLYLTFAEGDTKKKINAVTAFQTVTINGHRFGKEMR